MTASTFSPEVIDALRARDQSDLLRLLTQNPEQLKLADSNGYTLLHYAVIDGDESFFDFLLGKGVDVDARDVVGMSALHHAAQFGRTRMIQQLLRHGARIEAEDNEGMTPLMRASISRSGRADEVAKLLLSLGARMDLFSAVLLNSTDEVRKVLVTNPEAVQHCRSPAALIRTAIVYGNRDILNLLAQHGLSLAGVLIDGLTPLSFACLSSASVAVVETLLELGADQNAPNTEDQRTPLDFAIERQRFDIVQILKKAQNRLEDNR